MIYRSGGETFSPGPLSAKGQPDMALKGYRSHAEFESQCGLCHAPFEISQAELCIDCHQSISQQISAQQGTHSHIPNVNQCASCHPDHRGRDFDVTLAAMPMFDHSNTDFSLAWHQVNYDTTPMECIACHVIETRFKVNVDNCAYCHTSRDIEFMLNHIREFGEDCLACHDGQDRMVDFDHQRTAFPLEGKHLQVRCVECHKPVSEALSPMLTQQASQAMAPVQDQDPFKGTPSECSQCHAEPDLHKGYFSPNCIECHNASVWSPAILEGQNFDHATRTPFTLARHKVDYQNTIITCVGCHPSDIHQADLASCVPCHSQGEEKAAFMVRHQEEFGPACLDCHDGADRMENFDHGRVFVLDGRHAEIACEGCHRDKVFKGTPTQCALCHVEPAIHAGFFGLQCQNCHSSNAWAPAQLRIHRFPLGHGGTGEIECRVCHTSRYVEYTCYGCHDHQPNAIAERHAKAGVAPADLPYCTQCHPTGMIDVDSP